MKEKYLYHLTNKENLPSIFKNGLELRIGHNSKQVHEKEPLLCLCRYRDLPYWKAILGVSTVLRVKVDLEQCERYDYTYYSEFLCKQTIKPENIQKVYTPKTNMEQMRTLCFNNLYLLNNLTLAAARYYTYLDKYDESEKAERKETLGINLDGMLAVSKNLDYSSISQEELGKELRAIGDDGQYTFLDFYLRTHKRLYEQLIIYPKDDLYEKREKMYNWFKETFYGCLDVDTGGWTG